MDRKSLKMRQDRRFAVPKSWKRRIAIILSMLLLAINVTVDIHAQEKVADDVFLLADDFQCVEWAYDDVENTESVSGRLYAAGIRLKDEKKFYQSALKLLKNADYTGKLTCPKQEYRTYMDFMLLVIKQHPEYNYGVGVRAVYNSANPVASLNFRKRYETTTWDSIVKKMKAADKKAGRIIKRYIKAGMTDKEKCKAIHDYIVRNCQYEKEKAPSSNRFSDVYTAYGCLVNKRAVCQGYAAAFNLLAAKAGVCSIAVSGGNHAWNFVKAGNTYRYIDVTWDDPLPDRGKNGTIRTTYFWVKEAKLRLDHSWDGELFAKKYIKYSKQ